MPKEVFVDPIVLCVENNVLQLEKELLWEAPFACICMDIFETAVLNNLAGKVLLRLRYVDDDVALQTRIYV